MSVRTDFCRQMDLEWFAKKNHFKSTVVYFFFFDIATYFKFQFYELNHIMTVKISVFPALMHVVFTKIVIIIMLIAGPFSVYRFIENDVMC